MKLKSFASTRAVLFLAVFLSGGVARGGFVSSLSTTVGQQVGGLYRYDYTLADDAASTLSVVDFTLAVSTSSTLSALVAPSGWLITYATGDSSVDFASPDALTDITPGTSGAFSFLSPLPPSPGGYDILGLNEDTFELGLIQGNIASPTTSTVPEPSGLVLLGTGTLGLIGYSRRRRKALQGPSSAS